MVSIAGTLYRMRVGRVSLSERGQYDSGHEEEISMIYWLKKLEWKIRKALGLRKRRIRTLDDVMMFDQKLMWKLVIVVIIVMIAIRVGEGLTQLWWWFFPRVIRAPMEYL